jgi:type IV pilus assembly protein PilB
MGVERYLIASTLRLAIAQRLVRRLCPHCHRAAKLSEAQASALNRPEAAGRVAYEKVGCLYCGGRGTAGRMALFEFLPLDESWSTIVNRGAQEVEILDEMRKRGLPLLLDDALAKLGTGVTTYEEVRQAVAAW